MEVPAVGTVTVEYDEWSEKDNIVRPDKASYRKTSSRVGRDAERVNSGEPTMDFSNVESGEECSKEYGYEFLHTLSPDSTFHVQIFLFSAASERAIPIRCSGGPGGFVESDVVSPKQISARTLPPLFKRSTNYFFLLFQRNFSLCCIFHLIFLYRLSKPQLCFTLF